MQLSRAGEFYPGELCCLIRRGSCCDGADSGHPVDQLDICSTVLHTESKLMFTQLQPVTIWVWSIY